MKKGKHLVSLILAAAMAAGLSACGGQTAQQSTAAATEGTKQASEAAPAESQEKETAPAGKAEVTLSLNHVGATTILTSMVPSVSQNWFQRKQAAGLQWRFIPHPRLLPVQSQLSLYRWERLILPWSLPCLPRILYLR